jgi:serine/threonine protein kinase
VRQQRHRAGVLAYSWPGYCAPEVYLRKGYHKPADMYSLGVMTYALLSGCMPWIPTDIVGSALKHR